jgi:threonine/homoserine/homoserine lactone efflux protein
MSLHLLLKSVVLGLSIAAPVGPIAILCIRRSIVDGQAAGFICGLGAATADALYGALGGFAMTGISMWLVRGHVWMTVTGSAFLLYLGVKTFRAAPPAPGPAAVVGYGASFTMLLGVFCGSALWWLVLTAVAGTARRRLSPPLFAAINRVSGLVLAGLGSKMIVGIALGTTSQ